MFRTFLAGAAGLLLANFGIAQETRAPSTLPADASSMAPSAAPKCDAPICDTTPPATRSWFGAEALGWWVRGQSIPALVTTSAPGTALGSAGVLGAPTTSVLSGDSRVNGDMRFGGRFTAGYWLDDCQHCGIGAEFFILNQSGDTSVFSSTGTPILARPFTTFPGGVPSAQIVAFPNLSTGSVRTDASNNLLGAGIFGLKELCGGCNYRIYALAGYRYLRMDDEVDVTEQVTALRVPGGLPLGTSFVVSDSYRTVNQFHGADLGLAARVTQGNWFVNGQVRLGIGATSRSLTLDGSTVVGVPGQTATTFPSGFLVPVSSHQSDCAFSLVPDLRLNLGYRVTEHWDVFVGYNIMWWTNVIRAGDQIDTRVNPALIPPALGTGPIPALPTSSSTVWAQGISIGVIGRF